MLASIRRPYLLLLFCSLPLVLALSCHKEWPEPEVVPLPAELKAYVVFEPGTYWIYQDSASQQLDSVWVVSTDYTETREGGSKTSSYPDFKYENFRMQTRSRRGEPDRAYEVKRFCALPGRDDGDESGFPCWAVRRSILSDSLNDYGTFAFPYRIARDKAPAGYILGVMKAYWPTSARQIGQFSYPDLLEVAIPIHDDSEGSMPSHYSWAPHKGIVRLRTWRNHRPQTWVLLRSSTIQ